MDNAVDKELLASLKREAWNTVPKSKFAIPTTHNPLVNASRAIAVCAYPHRKYHKKNGKAEKYSTALLARAVRYSKQLGHLDRLPPWAQDMRVEAMNRHLISGHRNLLRAFTIRDLINSAQIMQMQHDNYRSGKSVTFTIQYSKDLNGMTMNLPMERTVEGYILSGCIPDTRLASLRAAILYHQEALYRFQGPAVSEYGRDEEFDYQNLYVRHVRPAILARHIVQVVWDAAIDLVDEVNNPDISIDDILMQNPEWASDIEAKTNLGLEIAIHFTRHLGVACCWCEMLRFASPLHDS